MHTTYPERGLPILLHAVIATTLGSTGTRAGVPDLALDSGLIHRLELDCQSFLTGHSVPPLTAYAVGYDCCLIIISPSLNNVKQAQISQNISRPCWRVHKKWSNNPTNKKDPNMIKKE